MFHQPGLVPVESGTDNALPGQGRQRRKDLLLAVFGLVQQYGEVSVKRRAVTGVEFFQQCGVHAVVDHIVVHPAGKIA